MKKTIKNIVSATVSAIAMILFVLLIVLGLLHFTGTLSREPRYFPTMEQAFARHPAGSRNFGETLFIYEEENNLTIFHRTDRQHYVSTFLKEYREGEVWYACIGVGTGAGVFDSSPRSRERLQEHIWRSTNRDWNRSHLDEWHERLQRRPVHGFFRGDIVYNLTINGVTVDYVVFAREIVDHFLYGTHDVYFWYIVDLPPITTGPDEIVISFDR